MGLLLVRFLRMLYIFSYTIQDLWGKMWSGVPRGVWGVLRATSASQTACRGWRRQQRKGMGQQERRTHTLAELQADESRNQQQQEQYSCHVALVGAPNTGKSTLANAVVGAKVSLLRDACTAQCPPPPISCRKEGHYGKGCTAVDSGSPPPLSCLRHVTDAPLMALPSRTGGCCIAPGPHHAKGGTLHLDGGKHSSGMHSEPMSKGKG